MLRVEKVATPFTAATVVVPASVPPAGLVPIARVTLLVAPVSRAPNWSRISTVTAGVIVAPAWVLIGCCTKATDVATGGLGGKWHAVLPESLNVFPATGMNFQA